MTSQHHLPVFQRHGRHWQDDSFVYPVISRRSKGLSIGINLNPDLACNFDCIYCQVDRSAAPRVRRVDVRLLRQELDHMLTIARNGSLYEDERFIDVPADLRRLNDVAFSGDGEPTTCPQFHECVNVVAELLQHHQLAGARMVLITDACYLTTARVAPALEVMHRHGGEIWAKLDAGTEEYHRLVTRPNFSLQHVVENITAAATARPIVIQSLFMNIRQEPPPLTEIEAFSQRLNDVLAAGGRIRLVQVYTVARRPAESYVTAMQFDNLQHIGQVVRDHTGLDVEVYAGSE